MANLGARFRAYRPLLHQRLHSLTARVLLYTTLWAVIGLVIIGVVIALVVHFGLMKSSYGAVLRGTGGNAQAIGRAGWSLLRTKVTMFALAGVFGVLSGLALIGNTTSADANIALRYTLLSIAGVILGGGEFVGGRVSPIGAVIGGLIIGLVSELVVGYVDIVGPDLRLLPGFVLVLVVLLVRPQGLFGTAKIGRA